MGDGRRSDAKRVWNALTSANNGIHHLQGDRQPSCRPDPLGHSKIENTVRYLGIDVEDALALAENTEI